jgi:hypothetical protein
MHTSGATQGAPEPEQLSLGPPVVTRVPVAVSVGVPVPVSVGVPECISVVLVPRSVVVSCGVVVSFELCSCVVVVSFELCPSVVVSVEVIELGASSRPPSFGLPLLSFELCCPVLVLALVIEWAASSRPASPRGLPVELDPLPLEVACASHSASHGLMQLGVPSQLEKQFA